IAGVLALRLRARAQWLCIGALLLGYWALLAWSGGFEPWTNLASRIDTAMLGPHGYLFDPATGRGHDPEGLLSTLPAIATTLLRLRAGDWLRHGRMRRLWLAGAAALALGALWSQVLPFIKSLCTSSYVVWSSGWAMLALAACHALVDLRAWPAVGRAFGVNAIAAYAGSALMVVVFAALGWWEPLY